MELLDRVSEIKLDDYNKFFLEDTSEEYQSYLNDILEFDPKVLKTFLASLKDDEISNNHAAEINNPLFLEVYSKLYRTNALERIIQIYKSKDKLQKEDLLTLHKILMRGTDLKETDTGFRKDNNRFVGAINRDGSKRIDYIPIDYIEIEDAIQKLLDYYNSNNTDNAFIIPFISHGIMAVMQPFNDGNTRMSRLVQYAKIWQLTNQLYNANLNSPALYLSYNYFISLRDYRMHQINLIQNNNNEAWNRWIKYNLNMVNEQLFYLKNNVKTLKRQIQ